MKPTTGLLLGLLIIPLAQGKPPADLQERLDSWTKGEAGGAAVAWIDSDGPVFFESGRFDGGDTRPITPDTEFEIGSVSKVFTALLLAESERLGKVSRNDPASKYLLPAGDPAQAGLARITLLSLTTHTAGLPRLPNNIGANPDANPDPYAGYDRAALVEALRFHGPTAPVGGAVAYSNFGVAVLGEALAAAWGTTYAEALREHVLMPLRMKATSVGLAGLPVPGDLAPGHAGGRRVPNWTFQAFAPAGALRSSARDMAVFLTAALGGNDSPLHAAFEATEQPQRVNEEVGGHIGLGWMLVDGPARPVVWHNGATAGYHSFVAFSPEAGLGVAILASFQKGCEKLGFGLLGSEGPQKPSTAAPNSADYPGSYPLSPAFVIQITEERSSLFLQATGQPRLALRPTTHDRFTVVGVPAEISFEREAAGKVVALVLHQNGLDQRALRGSLPPQPREVTLPIETLRQYCGKYPLAPSFILTVSEENGALFVQATGQGKAPIFASGKDDFFYKVVNAQLTFQRDSGGNVAGLVLHQNGQDVPARKTE